MTHPCVRPNPLIVGPRKNRWTLAAFAVAVLAGCGNKAAETTATPTCTPACDGKACGDDGCGGFCGTCQDGEVCKVDGLCATPTGPDACAQSCSELGYECGDHCGASCGTCPTGETCVNHACECAPKCSAATCGQDNGCGGTCGPCAAAVTCSDCALRLEVVSMERDTQNLIRTVTVALDFSPPVGSPLPAMADLRFALSGPAELVEVALGESLIAAEKGFFNDPETGRPYRLLGDGTLQLLVMSTANTRPISGGRWLFLTFRLMPRAPDAAGYVPLTLSLVERPEILAPAAADAVLWGGAYGTPIVVWPDAPVEVEHAP
jgi:hypothetical protein